MLTWSSHAASFIPPYQLGTCMACHGGNGKSLNPAWPNIGGQHAPYLLKQLQDMKAGKTRAAPVMTGILSQLTEPDLQALALYYAAQPQATGVTPEAYVKRGELLYRGGDFKRHVSACIACHGPGGEGNAQAGFPVLSGQHAPYTIQQLKAFSVGTRHNDVNSIMRDMSHRMSENDMQAVAYYIQGLYSRM
ncbi:MAG: c-type cytochrome [Gammaproteobacteria bacterium]|nr:c-type cytochrome [Gammaproteobacteria bacterium]